MTLLENDEKAHAFPPLSSETMQAWMNVLWYRSFQPAIPLIPALCELYTMLEERDDAFVPVPDIRFRGYAPRNDRPLARHVSRTLARLENISPAHGYTVEATPHPASTMRFQEGGCIVKVLEVCADGGKRVPIILPLPPRDLWYGKSGAGDIWTILDSAADVSRAYILPIEFTVDSHPDDTIEFPSLEQFIEDMIRMRKNASESMNFRFHFGLHGLDTYPFLAEMLIMWKKSKRITMDRIDIFDLRDSYTYDSWYLKAGNTTVFQGPVNIRDERDTSQTVSISELVFGAERILNRQQIYPLMGLLKERITTSVIAMYNAWTRLLPEGMTSVDKPYSDMLYTLMHASAVSALSLAFGQERHIQSMLRENGA